MHKRITQIDGLRGIASLLVMGFHFTTRYQDLYGHTTLILGLRFGYLGVQLFFAISGFVILLTLRNVKAPMDFVVSRFSRLYPAYWTALAFTVLLLTLAPLPGHELTTKQIAVNLTMFQGLLGITNVSDAYWSLEYELIFYVLMLLLWTLGALRRPLLPLAAWLGISILSKLVSTPWFITHLALLSWIPWFGLGVTAFVATGKHEDYKWWPLIAALSVVSIALSESVIHTVWSVGVLTLMLLAGSGSLKFLSSRVLLFAGSVSYPLYLIHEYLGYEIIQTAEAAGIHSAIAVALAMIICIGFAYAIHVFSETPAQDWIRNKYAKRTQPSNLRAWSAGLIGVMGAFVVISRLIK